MLNTALGPPEGMSQKEGEFKKCNVQFFFDGRLNSDFLACRNHFILYFSETLESDSFFPASGNCFNFFSFLFFCTDIFSPSGTVTETSGRNCKRNSIF